MNTNKHRVDIKVADRSDIGEITRYYQKHWRKGHIIADSKQYFLHEHLDDGKVNFLVASYPNDKTIVGLIGFTDYGGYGGYRHVTSTMLSVSADCKVPFLGIEMIKRLKELSKSTSYCGVTTDPVTIAPYVKRFLRHAVAEFDHYYIPNRDFSEYRVLINGQTNESIAQSITSLRMTEIFQFPEILGLQSVGVKQFNLPYKSIAYLNRRYFSHPIFKYRFFACLDSEENLDGLLVARIEYASGRTVFRVIDFVGPLSLLNKISWKLKALIQKEGHEYCDLFCSKAASFLNANGCFVNRRENGTTVPHYFHPYMQKNIDVLYETDCVENVYFKGDGDGDRPNSY